MPRIAENNQGVRTAKENDRAAIAGIVTSHGPRWDKPLVEKYLRDYFEHPAMFAKDEVFVLEENGEVVGAIGYCADRYESKNFWLGWLYVRKEDCDRGHAGKLLEHVKAQLGTRRARKLFVDTSSYEFYKNALHFYIACGFRFEAVIKNYYEPGEDQLILSIDL